MRKDNTTHVLAQFTRKPDIPVTRQTIGDELQKHPNYNSLLAFSDRLNICAYPMPKDCPIAEKTTVTEILKVNSEWYRMTEVKGIPALLINGRRLLRNYAPEDLKYFI